MTSKPPPIYASSFVKSPTTDASARVLQPCSVGSITWSLPTPIADTDTPADQAWKADTTFSRLFAIHSPKVNANDKLHAIGHLLRISTQVSAKQAQWVRFFNSHWRTPSNFTILGFYGSDGSRIVSTTTAADSQVLLPIDETTPRTATTRRSADVKWAHILCRLTYADVDSDCIPEDPDMDYEFYIELPQTTKSTLNSASNASNVTTYWGPSDLRTMTEATLRRDILLKPPAQRYPYGLVLPTAPSTVAHHDNGASSAQIQDDLLTVMFNASRSYFVGQVCPSHTSRPVDQLRTVSQSLQSSTGGRVVKPVTQFMNEWMSSIAVWANDEFFPLDVHSECIRNLDIAIQQQLEIDNYDAHLHPQPLDTQHQMKLLQQLQVAAIKAEKIIQRTEQQVGQYLTRQGADDATAHLTGTALSSQAERTLDHYRSGGKAKTDKVPECWHPDCKGPHRFGPDCPKFETPGAVEKVKQGKKEFYKRVKEAKQSRHRSRGANFSKMTSGQKKNFVNGLSATDFQELQRLHSSAHQSSSTDTAAEDTVTYALVPLLNFKHSSKPALPVSIDPQLPAMSMRFGTSSDASLSAVVRVAVDSGAGLTAGNMSFWLTICEGYPNIVHQIYTCHEGKYVPITLGGVVKQGDATVTTELPVALELKTPYFVGDPSAPRRLHVTIAIGPDVTANCIIGIPLLKPLGGCIDFSDNVLQLPRLIGTTNFPLSYERPEVKVPSLDQVLGHSKVDRSKHREVLSAIAQLRQTYLQSPPTHHGSVQQQLPAQQLRFADQTATSESGNPFVSPATQLIDSGDSTTQSDSESIVVSDIDQDYSAATNLLGLSNANREAGLSR